MLHYGTQLPWRRFPRPTMVGRQKTLMIRALLVAAAWLVTLPGPRPRPGLHQTPDLDPIAARAKGRVDAPVTVYEMSDFQCPYCREFALATMPLLEREYIQPGKVRFVYINLPLPSLHKNAASAAEVALCAARQQRFWPMHDLLFRHQDQWAPLASPRAFLLALGDSAGLDRARLTRCIGLAHRALPFAARFDKKLARGLDARSGVTERLAAWARTHRDPNRPLLWVHASSVGEGLQAKPVLEAVRAEAPHWQLAYTFFSPSAERLARSLPVDGAGYPPPDRPAEGGGALEAPRPPAALFSKRHPWPQLTLPFARLAIAPANTFTIVAGSTWPADEAVILPAFVDLLAQVPTARLVLAPHEPNPDHLAGIAQAAARVGLPRPVRLSQVEHTSSAPVIVVDRVGILADLYALADVAFVGGGYHRAGLHSVLEPAVFGVPVAVGPHWHMSRDATLLIERGGAVALSADGRHQLHSQWLVWHHDPGARAKAGAAGEPPGAAGGGGGGGPAGAGGKTGWGGGGGWGGGWGGG